MKAIRILAVVLCCALIFSINVFAESSTPWVGLYYGNNNTLNSYTLNSGVIVPDLNYRLGFIIYHKSLLPDYTYNFTVTIDMHQASAGYSHYTDDIYELSLVTGNPGKFDEGGNLINIADVQYMKDNERIIYNITFNTSDVQELINNTHLILACNPVYDNLIAIDFVSAYCNAIYDPEKTEMMQIIEKLDNIESNQSDILNTLESIQYDISYIINYGNNYNQIDQNIINGLGSAEDQLSNAEDAVQNKSQSLVNKVASQWSANKGVASSFLTTISPATTAIGTVTDNFFDAIPEEIKNAVITIMLIVFIGWLIGRVEG